MARMRYIKPSFWTDGKIVRLSPWARLLYIGSWNFALCDEGHLEDDAIALKLQVLPADPVDADELLAELMGAGRIVRKQLSDGRTYLHAVKLPDHQKVDARWASRCPYCTAAATPSLTEPPRGSPESADTPEDSPQEVEVDRSRRGKTKTSSSSGRTRGARLDPEWHPPPEVIAAIREECPGLDLRAHHRRFVDHWTAESGAKAAKLDWAATWRNWMRREYDRARGRPQPGGPSTTDSRVQAALDLAATLEAEGHGEPSIVRQLPRGAA
jgi:hypothetical protein